VRIGHAEPMDDDRDRDGAERDAGRPSGCEGHGIRRSAVAAQDDQHGCDRDRADRNGGSIAVEVAVSNLTGHKMPTGYPSRRAWLHLSVQDQQGRIVFESGAIDPTGRIRGNDNDADPARFERRYDEIRSADEVQIYESVMRTPAGTPTTGLLQAVGYIKDNRLLPRGFDKVTAAADIAVHGEAASDAMSLAADPRLAGN